jgi:hypothetical protein
MPKKVTEANSKEKWNFYFPKLLKLRMHHKLLDLGLQNRQSALLRALVRMFVNGDIPEDTIKSLIEEETYITSTDKVSTL